MICVEKLGESSATFLNRKLGVVGDVVSVTHERVHGRQRIALASRQQRKTVVEVLGVSARDVSADTIRGIELERMMLHSSAHATFLAKARNTSQSFFGFEITGRDERTS